MAAHSTQTSGLAEPLAALDGPRRPATVRARRLRDSNAEAMRRIPLIGLVMALAIGAASAAQAAACRSSSTFESWLGAFKREAAADGISQRAIAAAAPYLVYDQRVINI